MKKNMTMIILLAGFLLLTVGISSAQEDGISNGILTGVEAASPVNWKSDKLVWKTGKIDLINSDSVVIDDTNYRIPSSIHYFNTNGIIINSSSFNQGTEVTFVLLSDRKTIVKLIKDKIQN